MEIVFVKSIADVVWWCWFGLLQALTTMSIGRQDDVNLLVNAQARVLVTTRG